MLIAANLSIKKKVSLKLSTPKFVAQDVAYCTVRYIHTRYTWYRVRMF